MFLLHIKNKRKWNKNSNFFRILKHREYIEILKNKLFILQGFKQQKFIKSLSPALNKPVTNNNFIREDLISYVINIVLTNKNTLIYVTDVQGTLKYFQSAVSLNISGKQKTKQPNTLFKLLKSLIINCKFLKNKPIALHFKNVNKRLLVSLIKILENLLFIKIIRVYNFLTPHNGCRPKKIKRNKHINVKFK